MADLRRLHRADLEHPGVADGGVEAQAVALHRGVDEQLPSIASSVTSQATVVTSAPAAAQIVGRALELGSVARADDQRAALAGELAGQQQAESAGRAGDRRHLAVEIVVGAAGGQVGPREHACRDQRNRNFPAGPASRRTPPGNAPRRETGISAESEVDRRGPGGQGRGLA